MKTTKLYVVIPKSRIKQLVPGKRITGVNNLNNIHDRVLETIQKKFVDVVGYNMLPIAAMGTERICQMCDPNSTSSPSQTLVTKIDNYIPFNIKENAILNLEIDSDTILNIDHQVLLNTSYDVSNAMDKEEIAEILEEFYDQIYVGEPKDDSISFITYVALDTCISMSNFNIEDNEVARQHNIPSLDVSFRNIIAFRGGDFND